MTSQLNHLRSQLALLGKARSRARLAAAWAAVGSAVILALAAILILDLIFALAVPQRVVVLLLAGLAVGWACRWFAWPLWSIRENEIDTALVVEGRQRIDSDLVAALQFEQPAARGWGSPHLLGAVIEHVAVASPRIDVFAGMSPTQLVRRLGLFAACLAACLLFAALWPGHFLAFANRLFLGSRHYPTRTRIEQVVVNQTPAFTTDNVNLTPADAKAAQGRPVSFLVQCTGRVPRAGSIVVTASDASRQRTRIALTPLSLEERQERLRAAQQRISAGLQESSGPISAPWRDETLALLRCDAPAAAQLLGIAKTHADLQPIAERLAKASAELPSNYTVTTLLAGELGRLNDDVSYRVVAGDARTEAANLEMIRLPTIQVVLHPIPPKYARQRGEPVDASSRQVAVLAGSSVELAVQCTNGKPLESAWLTIQGGGSTERFELAPRDASRTSWKMLAQPSPLSHMTHELRYEVQVVDADGLSLESPIRGAIRIRPDLPPVSVAEIVHRVVLPTAAPVVAYRASDDFGLERLVLVAEVERQSAREAAAAAPAETSGEAAIPATPARAESVEIHRFGVLTTSEPLAADQLPIAGKYTLTLAPLKLAKGDRVKLTLEATDDRGQNEQGEPMGLAQSSDPLVLEISDESGVLAAIAEADSRSEQQLSEIIQKQLGIGEEAK